MSKYRIYLSFNLPLINVGTNEENLFLFHLSWSLTSSGFATLPLGEDTPRPRCVTVVGASLLVLHHLLSLQHCLWGRIPPGASLL